MTNKEKTKEIVLKAFEDGFYHFNSISQRKRFEKSLVEMAEWKEQQMIDYLYDNIQSLLKDYGVSEASADLVTQLFLANFKKAMKCGT